MASTELPIQFQTPTPKVLEAMDGYLQESEYENSWERSSVPSIYQNYADGKGWSHVEKVDENEFLRAWYDTINFITTRSISLEHIAKEQGLS